MMGPSIACPRHWGVSMYDVYEEGHLLLLRSFSATARIFEHFDRSINVTSADGAVSFRHSQKCRRALLAHAIMTTRGDDATDSGIVAHDAGFGVQTRRCRIGGRRRTGSETLFF